MACFVLQNLAEVANVMQYAMMHVFLFLLKRKIYGDAIRNKAITLVMILNFEVITCSLREINDEIGEIW